MNTIFYHFHRIKHVIRAWNWNWFEEMENTFFTPGENNNWGGDNPIRFREPFHGAI